MSHYSQNDEQEFVLEFFNGRVGRLLEIGAFDGITFSNSRALLESGWTGILVEPDPFNLVKLITNTHPSAQILCAAVSNKYEMARLCIESYPDRGWASTIDTKLMGPDRVLNPNKATVSIPTITMAELEMFGPFDFISIDAEGMDFRIIKSTPREMLEDCHLLCIEPNNADQRTEIKEHLKSVGFEVVHETPENVLARNETCTS